MANSESLPYVLPYSDAVFCCESPFISHFAGPENTALDCSKFPEKVLRKGGNQGAQNFILSTTFAISVDRIEFLGMDFSEWLFGGELGEANSYCAGRGTMVIASQGQIFIHNVHPVQAALLVFTWEVAGSSLMRMRQLSHGATAMQASQPVHWS